MATQPFSFLCRNEVHRYLGVKKRIELIKLVPALRAQNKRLGYKVTKVDYNDYSQNKVTLIVDNTTITINESANENNDEKVDMVVEIRRPSGTPTPSKRVEFKNCEQKAGIRAMAEKMLAFYLDRTGMFVHGYMKGIRWEHLRKWRNCIRIPYYRTYEMISTTGWWRELFRKVRASEFQLNYDSTSGVLLEIVKFVNSHCPIGTSVVLHVTKPLELHTMDQLTPQGAITDLKWSSNPDACGKRCLQATYPSHILMVAVEMNYIYQRSVTIKKMSTRQPERKVLVETQMIANMPFVTVRHINPFI